ncbi:hypothetical protein AB0D54_15620 [Streptomyces xanthophaeus]
MHGLWLLPTSWDRWATAFEEAGFAPVTPGWPDDPETVDEARAHPEVFAGKSVGQVADHFCGLIEQYPCPRCAPRAPSSATPPTTTARCP